MPIHVNMKYWRGTRKPHKSQAHQKDITWRGHDYDVPGDEWTEDFKNAICLHYYKLDTMGHPVMDYQLTDEEKQASYNEFLAFDYATKITGTWPNLCFEQSGGMHALELAWTYHPHYSKVVCGKMMTPDKAFRTKSIFMKVIQKRLEHGARITNSGIRKQLKTFTGTQCVSNFRPVSAAGIYDRLLEHVNGSIVWDMSCGFGGRLLGAMRCQRVKRYIGCDPASETFDGLERMVRDFKTLDPNRDLQIDIYKLGSETLEMRDKLPQGGVDLCFTSPPYFDTEKYSDEPTQSYMKYEGKNGWLYGFMTDTLANCHYALKPGGLLAINIADVKTYPELTDELVKHIDRDLSNEWHWIGRMDYGLSKIMGSQTTATGGKTGYKYEPLFVWEKR